MPRHSVTERSTLTLTSLRGPGLFAAAAAGAAIREVQIWNTATTAVAVGIRRATANGGAGTALTEAAWDLNKVVPQCTGVNTPTADHTGSDIFMQTALGAAAGAGVIWTFGDSGIVIPEGTGNGVFIFLVTGTAQVVDFAFVWDE
jgi:hypothetical protein